jgi:Uma2 family endonuclease
MTATIAQMPPKADIKDKKPKRLISLESFFQLYSNREDGFKYEWNNGIIEKTPRSMNRDQSTIQEELLAYFYSNPAFRPICGFLVELDMYIPTANRTRRADMAFLTRQQLEDSKTGDTSVAPFVIEVISSNDKINEVETKLTEYFDNGVQVVWQIFPFIGIVKVYTSVKDVLICNGEDVCTAAPFLPEFRMSVNQILR